MSRRPETRLATVAAALLAATLPPACSRSDVDIGSKRFPESAILGEMCAQLARGAGASVTHFEQLGGTTLLWDELRHGALDAYPEYTGTLRKEILSDTDVPDDDALRSIVGRYGVRMSRSLGFKNNYVIGMKETTAARLGIRRISDLAGHPDLKLGFTNEFMRREDGWPGLKSHYGLPHTNVRGLDHDIAYRALDTGSLDVIDLYSTDANIEYYDIRSLDDDRRYFPDYDAVLLYRADLETRAPDVVQALRRLEGLISAKQIRRLNARVSLERAKPSRVAADFLAASLGAADHAVEESAFAAFLRHTGQHLLLVATSLFLAIALAVPLGILCARRKRLAGVVLGGVGILQTIPSLALLAFMIPILGMLSADWSIGAPPTICALFLYSLLPIVRNTFVGLRDIPPPLLESAAALGLPPGARLRLVELPMASPAILAGIKTSAVINVGTATLGAFIGAGGYGEPIFTGISLKDTALILQGAVPAAALALLVEWGFATSERFLVPRGLRLPATSG